MSLRALSIAASGGRALLQQIDLLAANLANAQTVGFKRSRALAATLPGMNGAQLPPAETLFEAGKLQPTQRELDLAIEGDGFFRVVMPDQTVAFTRAGSLTLDPDGSLVTADGWRLDPPVQVPPGFTRIVVDPSGLVQGFDPEAPDELLPLGQIELSRFANPAGLQAAGANVFRATDAAGEQLDGRPGEGLGTIRQGHLEQSNVDPMRELAELVKLQRAFELNARVIQAADEVLQSINNLRRKA